jgi:putative PIN family toxin of toxin-antitoxin system
MTWRAVFDTNVTVSGLLWRGAPYSLFQEMRRHTDAPLRRPIQLFSSRFLLDELTTVLARRKFDQIFATWKMTRSYVIRQYVTLAKMVLPTYIPETIKNDPTDNQVLACALEADADVIVSGDQHLLSLGAYAGVEILSASDFLDKLIDGKQKDDD